MVITGIKNNTEHQRNEETHTNDLTLHFTITVSQSYFNLEKFGSCFMYYYDKCMFLFLFQLKKYKWQHK